MGKLRHGQLKDLALLQTAEGLQNKECLFQHRASNPGDRRFPGDLS